MKKIFLLSLCILFSGAVFASDDTQNGVKTKAEIKLEKIEAKKAAINAKAKEKISKLEIAENNIKAKENAKNEATRIKEEAKRARIAAKAQAKELKQNAIAQAKELELRAKEQEKAAIAQAKELKTANKTVVLQEVSNVKKADTAPVSAAPLINLTSYKNVNFETKKAEIVSGLKFSEKQQAEAEKIYDNAKEKIAAVNAQIVDKQQETNMVKLSKIDTKTQAERLTKLNGELEILYQKRDRLHNEAMKKFDNILDKEQKEAWDDAKTKGVRLFTELDEIKMPKETAS